MVSIGKLVSAGITYMCDRSTQTLQQWYTGTRHCMVLGARLWTARVHNREPHPAFGQRSPSCVLQKVRSDCFLVLATIACR